MKKLLLATALLALLGAAACDWIGDGRGVSGSVQKVTGPEPYPLDETNPNNIANPVHPMFRNKQECLDGLGKWIGEPIIGAPSGTGNYKLFYGDTIQSICERKFS